MTLSRPEGNMEAASGGGNRKGFPLSSPAENKEDLLEKVKAARQGRAYERHRHDCAAKVQALVRGWLARRRLRRQARSGLEEVLKSCNIPENLLSGSDTEFPAPLKIYEKIPPFLFHAKIGQDRTLLYTLCRYLIWSMSSKTMGKSFVAVMLNKDLAVSWMGHTKKLLTLCMNCLPNLDTGLTSENRHFTVFLHTLITFTSSTSWAFMKDEAKVGALAPGLRRLCENFLGHLIQEGMFLKLKAVLVRGTCSSGGTPSLKHAGLLALISLALRPLRPGGFSKNILLPFVANILAVPALVYNIEILAREILELFESNEILSRTANVLGDDDSFTSVVSGLDGNYVLSLLGNLVHLVYLDLEKSAKVSPVAEASSGLTASSSVDADQSLCGLSCSSIVDQMELVIVFIKLIDSCRDRVDESTSGGMKKKNKTASTSVWHPILGWYSQPIDRQIHDALPSVWKQLNFLWSLPVIRFVFRDLFTMEKEYAKYFSESLPPTPLPMTIGDAFVREAKAERGPSAFVAMTTSHAWSTFKKMVEKGSGLINSSSTGSDAHPKMKLGGSTVTSVAISSQVYTMALKTLKENRVAILSGLCARGELLARIWRLLRCLGKKETCGLAQWLDALAADPDATLPHFDLLTLFCEASAYLLTILDDKELYEDQKPFRLEDLVSLSSFLNNFVFYGLYNGYVDPSRAGTCGPFLSVHSLLMVIYQRDSRRPFCPVDHWLMKDASSSAFMYDVEKKKYAQLILRKIPHVVPHSRRVVLFRDCVTQDKLELGLIDSASSSAKPPCTLITVRRTYIVEDGYRQLIGLTPTQLKGAVRVKFVNAQGLDEAGIDQDGVFKEFLEETVKRVFDPGMNLFKTTSEGRIYPSPTSYINENCQQLFEFVGRMLAKAVFEGIVVDVPFAQFFLSQIVGSQHSGAYSCMDELPSLDPELYKNLTYVKHYDGDVSDLELTFTCDEDVLGQVVTHELVPGGRIVQVTNDNKILYVHKMAHFRMRTQIQNQVAAFRNGFRSIINPDWLAWFSTPEVQRLISGDTNSIDLKDLRRNTQYYGGFHDKHRIICWLWDILDKDFTEQERRLFLKFVTSCSSPPLLGFGNLEPPFSIRCVEVGEDEDTGDTIGSVLRGFFTIRKKDPVGRLPTSSTCFNLLKLPNYQKKSTLKEKLRYAIHSNTGFELS